ncbi:MAG: hypothetical protein WDZ69_01140 [Candidatus Pacearchaeota archaeon]
MERESKYKKRKFILLVSSILFLTIIFSFSMNVSAQEVSYCAERTTSGAWCQNVPLDEVDTDYEYLETSCDSAAYCQLGTCVDSAEGLCSQNVPRRVCEDSGGSWDERERSEITPQCQLGCCLAGDGASFVTQTRCTSISSLYGAETTFRGDIQDPIQCVGMASPQEKGACVFDDEFSRDCRMLTREECQTEEANSGDETDVEFHEGFLCSAEALGTVCGPSRETTLVEGRPEVFFTDTCGNIANVYDASKINPTDQDYWTNVIEPRESCSLNSDFSNAGQCGNCDDLAGSIGRRYERGNEQTSVSPDYGNFVCSDLSCNFNGERYFDGERWCSTTTEERVEENSPGSEHYRLHCSSGEILIEEAGDPRQTVCIEDEIQTEGGPFRIAEFRANKWQDCWTIDNQQECEDIQQRDCMWKEGQSILRDEDEGNLMVINEEGALVPRSESDSEEGASCVPRYPPGLDFWNSEGSSQEACMVANENCVVKFERTIYKSIVKPSDWKCVENCHCVGLSEDNRREGVDSTFSSILDSEWFEDRSNMCMALGDCGSGKNYLGVEGYWEKEELVELDRNIE